MSWSMSLDARASLRGLLRPALSLLVVALAARRAAGPLRAEEPGSASPAPARSGGDGETGKLLAFRAGRLVDSSGEEIESATLLVRLGHIDAVLGSDGKIPPEAEVIELGDDARVLPVFIDPLSQIHRLGSSTRRAQSPVIGGSRSRAGDSRRSRAVDQIDPAQDIYARLVRTGYGAFALVPNNGVFLSGQAAIVRPRKTKEKKDLLLEEDSYLYMTYGLGKSFRTLAEREFKKAIDQAEKILKARSEKKSEKKKGDKAAAGKEAKPEAEKKPAAAAKAAGPPKPPPPPGPLVQAFLGERDVFLRAEEPAVIDHALGVLDGLSRRFDFVLVTDPQEEDFVEGLARRRGQLRGVVLQPRLSRIYDTSIYLNSARFFEKYEIPVAFVPLTDDVQGHEDIVFYLGEMVKTGMSPGQALRAVTLTPAEFLRIDDRLGSLAPGKEASFAVYDGDPFSGNAKLKKVFFLGEEVFPGESEDGKTAPEVARKGSE